MVENKSVRGLRNNNPFNIKKSSSAWKGKVLGDDQVFETFSTMEYGVRAGLKLLSNYVKNGFNTPRKIIGRFAPTSENNTKAYLDFVCFSPFGHIWLGLDSYVGDLEVLCRFASRIIQFECGLSVPKLSNLGLNPSALLKIYKKYIL